MIKDYHFKDIQNYLKKESELGKDILDAFDTLSDAAILFSPIVFGPQLLPLLELLDVKDRLSSLGHKVYDAITQRIEPDYIDRTEQIRAAYSLICYTSYFDVLPDALPKKVRNKLLKNFTEKKALIEEASDRLAQSTRPMPDIRCKLFYADHITSFSEIRDHLSKIYTRITNKIVDMINNSHIFNEDNEKEKNEYDQIINELNLLPDKALAVYEAQYIKLADEFNDFALFAQLQNFDGIHHALEVNKDALNSLAKLTKQIDVGLSNLSSIVNSISTNYCAIQAQDIVDDLKNKYYSFIEEPIIDDKEIASDKETIPLRFPKIVDAYIPQSYKCVLYEHKETKLEDPAVWKKSTTQHDIDRFFLKYLYSPDSIDYPLIILGHPGSGKSLLTKVLSAQLMSSSYTVVRIPLRDVNAEDGIDVLVEDQIKKTTNRPLPQGYGGFASQFNEKPLIIILDGYDELLQAKGDIFSGYLEKVRMFQQDQKVLKRPVRVIITSRVTLIDKARIPINSTILRLMEFGPKQRQTWIDIWNNINMDYFTNSNVKPFSLPLKEKGNKNNILELAEQPLLLLMLALYDSEANELAQTSNINRTELYDNLIRRFVRRERSRYVPGFIDKTEQEQESIIDQEMNRLGVVAIGMYNRQEVVIQSKQLEGDIELYHAHRDDGSKKPQTLKESESVLGGFFFIHKSTAKDADAHSDHSESAYEFLHNTFGEFLAADFILRNTIKEVKDIYVDRLFKADTIENKLSNPNSLDPKWFYCLMFVPLYSRPVVVEMLREHKQNALQHALKNYNGALSINLENFVENLKFLVRNQLNLVLNTRKVPSVMCNGILSDRDIPLLGYLSIYSLNLIILACTLSPDGFIFNEDEFYHDDLITHNDLRKKETKPWEKLISLWKSWFSPDDLVGLSVILRAKRKAGSDIHIECKKHFEATLYDQPIDILLSISSTLADNLLLGLSGLQTQRFDEITRMTNKDVSNLLKDVNPDIYISHLIIQLRKTLAYFSDRTLDGFDLKSNYRRVNDIIETIIHVKNLSNINQNTRLNLFEVLEACLIRDVVFSTTRRNILIIFPHLIDSNKFSLKSDEDVPELISGARFLSLLLRKNGILSLSRRFFYETPYFASVSLEKNWSEEMERITHHFSRIIGRGRFTSLAYDWKNSRSIVISMPKEKSMKLGLEDMSDLLGQLLTPDGIEIFLKTKPAFIAHIVRSIIEEHDIEREIVNEIVETFLAGCISEINLAGIICFGFDAITDAICIAETVNKKYFLSDLRREIEMQLFNTHPEFFCSIVQMHPSFISKLIDIMPDLFVTQSLNVFDPFYIERRLRYEQPDNWFEYIQIVRKLFYYSDKKYVNNRKYNDVMHVFERLINNNDSLNRIDYKKLTIEKIDSLLWYAKITGNTNLKRKIESILSKVPVGL